MGTGVPGAQDQGKKWAVRVCGWRGLVRWDLLLLVGGDGEAGKGCAWCWKQRNWSLSGFLGAWTGVAGYFACPWLLIFWLPVPFEILACADPLRCGQGQGAPREPSL